MTRAIIPKKTKDAVLDEYSHRCAVCAGDRPHIHHIDEDAGNNSPMNLLPLCPNCHLRDQHNPTRKIEIGKLQMFRKFKDPAILRPQFHPIYARQHFLEGIEAGSDSTDHLARQALELTELVTEMEMGAFYAKRLNELLSSSNRMAMLPFPGNDAELDRQFAKHYSEHREKLLANKTSVQALLVEMLRYQPWANAA
jgi:hypothetical protein